MGLLQLGLGAQCLLSRGGSYPFLAAEFGRTPSRSEDIHRPCDRGIVAFVLALGPIVGANAVIVIGTASVRHSIGGVTASIARIMPAIAAIRGRIVCIMACSARLIGTRDPIRVRTGHVVARITSVKCRFGLNIDASDPSCARCLSDVRDALSVIPRTMLVT
jgi:hypothetical protein